MINGVLVERTIKDVEPALRTNSEGLKKVLDDLVKQYKSKQDEMEKWKVSFSNPFVIRLSPLSLLMARGPLTRRSKRYRLIERTIVEEEQHPGCAAVIVAHRVLLHLCMGGVTANSICRGCLGILENASK